MKTYLFFDTESSNCYGNIYKMCEFGCLTADTGFSILPGTKKDILMNPGKDGKFNLVGRKDGRDLILAHDHEEYGKSPYFDNFYGNIEFFLKQKDATIFLWSGENDIKALLDQCWRYRLPALSFLSYDVQLIYMNVMDTEGKTPSLESAAEQLGIDISGLVQHRPDDDSLITMLVLKALCEKTGKTPQDLVDDCPRCKMDSIPTYNNLNMRHREREKKKKEEEARRMELAPYNAELNGLFAANYPEDAPREKTFSVSLNMKRNVKETLPKIKDWLASGFYLKRKLNCGFLVYYDEEERQKLLNVLDLTELKLVSIEEFDELTKKA